MLVALEQGTSAAVGGAIATAVLFPLDVLRTKLAVSTDKTESSAKTIVRILQTQGIYGLFGGLSPKLVQSSLGKFLYFIFYTTFVQQLQRVHPSSTTAVKQAKKKKKKRIFFLKKNFFFDHDDKELLACGYLAEACHLPLTIPLEVVTTRMQKDGSGQSVLSIIKSLFASGGLWRGWRVYAFLCCQPAIQFVLFERLKGASGATSLSALHAFLLGAIARAVAILLTFPFTRARTILQTAKDKEDDKTPKGVVALLAQLIKQVSLFVFFIRFFFLLLLFFFKKKKDGFFSLYRGFGPELVRGVLSSAVMLMIKERVQFKFSK